MPRGECKIWSLTYSRIAEWTGLRVVTVRNCASRGDFDPRDVESVLSWVNTRRQRLGLPMIGVPDGDNQVDAYQHARNLTTLETASLLVYDPRTASFRENL